MRKLIAATVLIFAFTAGASVVIRGTTGNEAVVDSGNNLQTVTNLTGWSSITTGLTTSTTLSQLVAASGSNRIYVKSWKCSASAASTTAANEQCRIKSGTGAACENATTDVDGCFTPALGGCLGGEVVLPAGHALCVQHAVAGSKIFTVTYRQAP